MQKTWLTTLLLILPVATKAFGAGKVTPKLTDENKIINELQQGGYVIYLRHHATNKNEEDKDKKNLKKCNHQRNLSEEGRQGSKEIGQAFKKLSIKVSKVISSPYCRCIDTGKLAFGDVIVNNDLHFSIGVDQKERKRRSASLNKLLNTPPEAGLNTVIISHTANLKEAVGIWPKPEGVMHIFKPRASQSFTYIGKLEPETWKAKLIEKI